MIWGFLASSKMVRYAAVAVAAVAALHFYGNYKVAQGKRELLLQIETARVSAVSEKKEIENEINQLNDEDLLSRALGSVRPDPGR